MSPDCIRRTHADAVTRRDAARARKVANLDAARAGVR